MKKDKVLVLGCGSDLTQRVNADSSAGPLFSDNFEQVVTMDIDPSCNPTFCCSIDYPWTYAMTGIQDLETSLRGFDEVHAYEVLHLVGPGDKGFFGVWRNIWDVLKPGGLVFGMVPWWESKWAWQDPATCHVYTAEKLFCLNQRSFSAPMFTNYSRFFPKPYSFVLRSPNLIAGETGMRGDDPKNAGFTFVLQKEVFDGT